MALTAKQQRFVDEYLIDLNATQAATRAGYSKKMVNEQGSRLLANVSVDAAIHQRMNERSGRVEITQDMVLCELAKIGFSDIRKVVRWGETQVRMVPYHGLALIDTTGVDDETAAAIAEVSRGRDGLKVELHDKKGALVDIGRHLGMFNAPGHPELDAELKRLEVEKRRVQLKQIEKDGGNSNAQLLTDLISRLPS